MLAVMLILSCSEPVVPSEETFVLAFSNDVRGEIEPCG